MEKEFIPYEESLDLKELGIEEKCIYHYKRSTEHILIHSKIPTFESKHPNGSNHNELPSRVSSPLYQQAFRWFREKYPDINFCLPLKKEKDLGIFWGGFINNKSYGSNYKTYEEAELACLRKLIEIVKNKI